MSAFSRFHPRVTFLATICIFSASLAAPQTTSTLFLKSIPPSVAKSPWPQTIIVDPQATERRQILLSHGINPLPLDLLRFLQGGFQENTLPKGLPEKPLLKSEVVSAAIIELGLTAIQEAVPVLSAIAREEEPDGVRRIVARDFEQIPIDNQEAQVGLMKHALALNAITALGYIGDPAAAPTILDAMRSQTSTAFVTKGAIALGQMGSKDGTPALVLLASDPNNNDSIAAFDAIYILTGRNYGYSINTPLAKRLQLITQLKEWLESPDAKLAPNRADVMRRLDNPPRPTDYTNDTSLRGLLKRSVDITSYDNRFYAREELKKNTAQRFDDLKVICEDVTEDLDARRASMQWLCIANPSKARAIIRRLQKDENMSIAEYARSLEKDIDDAEDAAKNRKKDAR